MSGADGYDQAADDYGSVDDYRQSSSIPGRPGDGAPGGGGEGAPLLGAGQAGVATSFTQIEHVPIQTPANVQPSLIHIDGKAV
jgi:hypothetical protein